jgi:hypothetical protein
MNWGFSDQIFLVRRRALMSVDFRTFSPAAFCRHGNKDHPGSFEARVEAYQRGHSLARATYCPIHYSHNDSIGDVMERSGRTLKGRAIASLLGLLEKMLLKFRFIFKSSPRFRLP